MCTPCICMHEPCSCIRCAHLATPFLPPLVRHAQQNATLAEQPKFILEDGASVAFGRIFFRNFLPNAASGPAGAQRRTALLARGSRPDAAYDWESPVAFVRSNGGTASYNLVVWHFQSEMTWVFDQQETYW